MVSGRQTKICRVSMIAVGRGGGGGVGRGAQLFTTGARRLDSEIETDACLYCVI